jgi:hypothetical protein
MKPNPQILSDSKLLDLEAFDVIEEDPHDASAVELGLNCWIFGWRILKQSYWET